MATIFSKCFWLQWLQSYSIGKIFKKAASLAQKNIDLATPNML
jgi:hypothetical protein